MKTQMNGKLKYTIQPWKSSRGANLLETAFILGLLLLLTFAIIDFSSVLYVYLSLENGVSQATRYAVTGQVMGTSTREQSIRQAMRQATPTLTIQDSDFTFQRWNGSGWASGTGGPNDIIRVTVAHSVTFFTPLLRPFFPAGGLILSATSTMRNEPFPTSGS